jgi:hypothetical protein
LFHGDPPLVLKILPLFPCGGYNDQRWAGQAAKGLC